MLARAVLSQMGEASVQATTTKKTASCRRVFLLLELEGRRKITFSLATTLSLDVSLSLLLAAVEPNNGKKSFMKFCVFLKYLRNSTDTFCVFFEG